jgi:hypothetical protein
MWRQDIIDGLPWKLEWFKQSFFFQSNYNVPTLWRRGWVKIKLVDDEGILNDLNALQFKYVIILQKWNEVKKVLGEYHCIIGWKTLPLSSTLKQLEINDAIILLRQGGIKILLKDY